ncbi:hypothetical protein [Chitinophaga qingshengii]|uniref:DUF4190 domain-containing protein n=1 Tax=Chitinophaga qingshengii TaxID=1569794 RepID=A0ABR7TMH7_9BACT|nr:hypothetical protein [Chitinophaga qingshengii]MBC9931684.1 hypothetical protein [Chitinophaga qingshengii]
MTARFYQNVYIFLLVTGIILLVFAFLIYRRTFIPILIPIGIIVVTGLIAFVLMRNHYNRVYGIRGFFYALSNSLLAYGGIACFLFLLINYYGASMVDEGRVIPVKRKHLFVDSTGRITSMEKPSVIIHYQGVDKQLLFDFSRYPQVIQAEYVVIDFSRGYFGYDILHSYDVVERLPEPAE